ncbi:hypothetical protein VP01_1278g1 [Puccinia sorghi]|uniref:Splicing factor 3B subunit 5 n=1 Tax=Puccinia sorghi TaxID=27349 RepID=A0A0L6VNU7_9BASI|nr:hypothetical protein VP01_1278g1 [Puccinia sorghi]
MVNQKFRKEHKGCMNLFRGGSHTNILAVLLNAQSELRYTANTQLEQLHARYVGTGHADITKHEWLTHQHRDTYTSVIGHPALLLYLATAEGQRIGRTKFELCEIEFFFSSALASALWCTSTQR